MKKDKEWLKIQVEDILYRLELSGDISTPLGNIIEQRIGKKIDQLDETPDYEKLKEDHELLKKFFYETRNHSAEKSRRIDELEDKVEAYEKADKEMFSLLKNQQETNDILENKIREQQQYEDFLHDTLVGWWNK